MEGFFDRTNNGVIYVLDKVLENHSATSPTTPDDSTGTSPAPSSTSTKSWASGQGDARNIVLSVGVVLAGVLVAWL